MTIERSDQTLEIEGRLRKRKRPSFAAIAREFGVSREWVRRVADRMGIRARPWHSAEETLEFCRPFFAAANVAAKCLCCGGKKTVGYLCADCQKVNHRARILASRLRRGQAGRLQDLKQAASMIRNWGITPERLGQLLRLRW